LTHYYPFSLINELDDGKIRRLISYFPAVIFDSNPLWCKTTTPKRFSLGNHVLKKITRRLEKDKVSWAEEKSATAGGRSGGFDS
jgi:hypothetical protein